MVKPDIGRAFSVGMEMTKKDWLSHFGILLVIGILGGITFHIMTPALFGAYFVVLGAASRGEQMTLSRIFETARGHYLRCFGGGILLVLMIYGIYLVVLVPAGIIIGLLAWGADEMKMDRDAIPCIIMGLGAPVLLFLILFQIWIMTRWMFIFPIMVGMNASFSDARAMSVRWVTTRGGVVMHFVFSFVSNLIAQIGQMLCCVGMVFTVPLGMSMKGVLFQDHLEEERGGAMRPPFGGKQLR